MFLRDGQHTLEFYLPTGHSKQEKKKFSIESPLVILPVGHFGGSSLNQK